MAFDRFGRRLHYLRISLTDRCNLRCQYCMPEEMIFLPGSELLQDDEILRLVRLFARLGFDKFRLTGGEPTVRANIVDLVRRIANTPGVKTLSMTTNGVLFSRLAGSLAEAGLQRVNFSLDTLNREKFRRITRWGNLDDVWRGIQAAEEAGFSPIKINAVIVRGHNEEDVVDLAQLTLTRPWQVRFIEMMPLGEMAEYQKSQAISAQEVKSSIESALGSLEAINGGELDGEARLYRFPEAVGVIGFISSVTQPFCYSCTRIRLTADGRLRLCLLNDKEVNLLLPLRQGASDEELRRLIVESIWEKPWGHQLAQEKAPRSRTMNAIGG